MPTPDEQTPPDSRANTPFYADKSFLLVVLSPLLLLLSKKLGVQLDATEIASLAAQVIGFIVFNKWKSGKLAAEEIRAEAQVRAAQVQKGAEASPEEASAALAKLIAAASQPKAGPGTPQ